MDKLNGTSARRALSRGAAGFAALALLWGCSGKKFPDGAEASMRAGLDALYTRHQPAEAAEDFRKVLASNPGHYGANFQFAYALEQAGRKDEAAAQWQKVVMMATATHDTSTVQFARTHLAGLGSREEDALMRAGLDALYKRHQPVEAVADFRKVLAMNPGHYGANFQIAVALELAGNRDESRIYWTKSLSMAQAFHDDATAKAAREHLDKLGK